MAVCRSGTCFGDRLGLANTRREWAYGQHWWNYNTVLWWDKKLFRWRNEWRIYSRWFYTTHRNPKPRGTVLQNVFLCHGHAPWCRAGFEHKPFNSALFLFFFCLFVCLGFFFVDVILEEEQNFTNVCSVTRHILSVQPTLHPTSCNGPSKLALQEYQWKAIINKVFFDSAGVHLTG